MRLKAYAAQTYQGPFLNLNEDDYVVDLDTSLFLVLDGFGGTGIGDVAVKLVREKIQAFFSGFCRDPEITFPFYLGHRYLLESNALINSVNLAHKALCKENSKVDLNKRGGTSLIASTLSDGVLFIASVGNCLPILIRNHKIHLLRLPDSLSTYYGYTSFDFFKNIPLSALGLFDDVQVHINEVKVEKGDVFIYLTDGVYSYLSNPDLLEVFNKVKYDHSEKLQLLFDMANRQGNEDNQTGMVLSF